MYLKAFCVVFLSLLVGCGTARTVVTDPVEVAEPVTGIVVQYNKKGTVNVPADASRVFETALRKELFSSKKFKEGGNLVVSYRFIQFSEGSRLSRWFTAGIGNAGEGSLIVEVEYFINGKKVGKVQTDGRIGSGWFGGSVDHAIEKAAEEVARHTFSQFNA